MTVIACSHTAIAVGDLTTSRRFYCEALGFEPFATGSGDQPPVTRDEEVGRAMAQLFELDEYEAGVELLTRDGMTIELVAYEKPAAKQAGRRSNSYCGLTHLCFDVDDIEDTAAKIVELGGSVLEHTDQTVAFTPGTKVRLLMCLDPDGGTKLELKQQDRPA